MGRPRKEEGLQELEIGMMYGNNDRGLGIPFSVKFANHHVFFVETFNKKGEAKSRIVNINVMQFNSFIKKGQNNFVNQLTSTYGKVEHINIPA